MSYDPAKGFNRVMPALVYKDVAAALEWLSNAFGLTEHLRWADPKSGEVLHSEMRYGDNAFIEVTAGPQNEGLLIIVDDVDAHFDRAKAAGAEITSEPEDKPWGLRQYSCKDPEGRTWGFGQHVRDVDPAEWGAVLAT